MDVHRCPRCWKPSPFGAAFCRRCGRALGTWAPPPLPAAVVPPLPPRARPPRLPPRLRRPARRPTRALLAVALGVAAVVVVSFLRRVPEPDRWCTTHHSTFILESPAPTPPPVVEEPPPVPPRIEWVSAGSVHASVPLVIRGEGLGRVERVLLVGLHDGRREVASFRSRGDDLLYVTVPDMGQDPQDLMVVIITPRGAAVCPSDTPVRYAGR